MSRKINNLRLERGWSVYKLANETGLPQQTINQWFNSETMPSIYNLGLICDAFGLTLSEFFAEGELIEAHDEVKELYKKWSCLSKEEQDSIKTIIDIYLSNNGNANNEIDDIITDIVKACYFVSQSETLHGICGDYVSIEIHKTYFHHVRLHIHAYEISGVRIQAIQVGMSSAVCLKFAELVDVSALAHAHHKFCNGRYAQFYFF